MALMKSPYLIATSACLATGSAGFSTTFSWAKSTPAVIRPITGMITSSTRAETILLNAAPMITPTARSMTLPREMNSRNSLKIFMALRLPEGAPEAGVGRA